MNGDILVVCEDQGHAEPYALALATAGLDGRGARVVTPAEAQGADRLAANASGILLCGGPDLEPWRFGEEPLPGASLSLLPELDALEWEVLGAARRERVPVWAICRGMQVLNVFLGGSLWQDVPSQLTDVVEHRVPRPRDALAHAIEMVRRDHPFAERLAGEEPRVNSRHHQAIRRLAPGLDVIATAPDGVIEVVAGPAVEPEEGWWLRGVQWHPENLTALEIQRQLFVDFLAAASRFAAAHAV